MDKSLTNFLSFTKRLLYPALKGDGVYIDFTMGNGYDTLFLAKYAPNGRVYAFDVQQAALDSTNVKLEAEGIVNTDLILDSHANIDKYVKEPIDGGLFNLRWLPGGGDKTITTQYESTIEALQKGLDLLKIDGVIVVAVYPGHEAGAHEGKMIQEWAGSLNKEKYDVLLHRLINVPECQYLVAFQKKA